MKILLTVNESPWSASLASAALRFAKAALAQKLELTAVFFRNDGVYHALPGAATDAGAADLHREWRELAATGATELLCCSAAVARRFGTDALPADSQCFRMAGLVEVLDRMQGCDRVVTF